MIVFERQTISHSVSIKGIGLHSGVPVEVHLHPAEDGIHFRWGTERTKAHPANVTNTTRQTTLGSVRTVEHLMSALAGLAITDVEIEVSAPELPGLDGSALEYVRLIDGVEKRSLGTREIPNLFRRLWTNDETSGGEVAVGGGTGHWRYVFDLGDRWPGSQTYETSRVLSVYSQEIAPARTLVLSEEIEVAERLGLGRGLDDRSVVVIGLEGFETPVRFADEPARHKLLDAIGDMYLCGVPIDHLNVTVEKGGHSLHIAAALQLARALNL